MWHQWSVSMTWINLDWPPCRLSCLLLIALTGSDFIEWLLFVQLPVIYTAHNANITAFFLVCLFFFFMLQQHQPLAAMETSGSGMLSLGVRCQHLLRLLTTAEMTFLEPWQQVLPLPPPSPQFQLQSLVLPQQTCLTWWGRLSPSHPPRALTLAWAAHRVWAPPSCPSLGHRYAWLHSYTRILFFHNSLIYISLQDAWRGYSVIQFEAKYPRGNDNTLISAFLMTAILDRNWNIQNLCYHLNIFFKPTVTTV